MSNLDGAVDRDTVEREAWIDEICDRFEDACRASPRPAIAEFLRLMGIDPDSADPNLLRELTRVEAAYQSVAANPVPTNALTDSCEAPLATLSFRHDDQTASAPPDVDCSAAQFVPGYEILGELGRGGMGVVYKARQRKLNRLVALKIVLGGERAGRTELIRFLAEAESVAAVKHDHVVQVYEYGEYAARPFLAMEYLPGGTLAERLKGGPLPPREAAGLVAKVAAAVGAAHELGIIHRDLKPGNVLFGEVGEPKVTDFGLAKQAAKSDLTLTGAMMGTPAYMSPEQARGESKFATPTTDVWALGVILYECLTGTRPFEAPADLPREQQGLVLLDRVKEADPAPPRSRRPGLPRDLELICLKCLAKYPDDRYPTAKELADDLRRFVARQPLSIRPAGRLERVVKWTRRNPTRAAALGLTFTVILLLGFGVTLAVLWQRADKSRRAAESAEDRLARVEYGRSMRVAYEMSRVSHTTFRTLLDAARPDLRGWEWWYLYRLSHPELVQPGAQNSRGMMAWSPDGSRRVGWAKNHKSEFVRDTKSGVDLVTFAWSGGEVRTARFSPDGTHIHTLEEGDMVRVIDATTGIQLAATRLQGQLGQRNNDACDAFSPDGSRVVTVEIPGTARVWDAKTGKMLLLIRTDIERVSPEPFSPDGSRLVTIGAYGDEKVRVWDVAAGKEQLVLPGHIGGARTASFSRDGQRIVTGGYDRIARVWDARTGAEISVLKGHEHVIQSAAFSPDGVRVVTGAKDNTLRIWDVITSEQLFILSVSSSDYVSWSPDGARIEDSSGRLWDANCGGRILSLPGRTVLDSENWNVPFHPVCYSPDGSLIVTGSTDQTAKVWDAKTGTEIMTLRGHLAPVKSVEFSPRGEHVRTFARDGVAKVWDVKTGTEILSLILLGLSDPVWSGSWSPDGTRIVTVGTDRVARVWDAKTGTQLIPLLPHAAYSAAWNPDGTQIVTGGKEGVARIWDAKTGKQVHAMGAQGGMVLSMAWSLDGTRIVTASSPHGTVKIWNAKTGEELLDLKTKVRENIIFTCVSWSRDGTWVIAASPYCDIHLWDANTGALHLEKEGRKDEWMFSAAISPDNKRVATGSLQQFTRVRELATGDEVFALKGHLSSSEIKSFNSVPYSPFSPDESRLLVSADEGIHILNARTGTTLKTLDFQKSEDLLVLGRETVFVARRRVAWSPDGGRVVVRDQETICIFDTLTGRTLRTIPDILRTMRGGGSSSVSFSPDGTRIMKAGSITDIGLYARANFDRAKRNGDVKIYDAATGAEIHALSGTSASWSPDGSRVVTGYDIDLTLPKIGGHLNVARIWDAWTGAEILIIPDAGNVPSAAWSPDGSRLIAGGKIWDANKGTLLATLSRTDLEELAWSPDGSRLVAPGPNGTAVVLDAATGVEVLALKSPAAAVLSATWSPDGSRIRAVCSDGTIRIWDARPVNPESIPGDVPLPPWLVRP